LRPQAEQIGQGQSPRSQYPGRKKFPPIHWTCTNSSFGFHGNLSDTGTETGPTLLLRQTITQNSKTSYGKRLVPAEKETPAANHIDHILYDRQNLCQPEPLLISTIFPQDFRPRCFFQSMILGGIGERLPESEPSPQILQSRLHRFSGTR
jgi:hypothetical protein